MTATVATSEASRRKAGRPPRISRAMIAETAHELGLEGLTLKAVADHLGVTVAALYHHVSGKEDLMRVAAEESTRAIPLPVDRGQHWAQWLLEWAHYNFAVFNAQPGLLGQYLEGAIRPESVVHNLEAILSVLVREGFSVADANAAYELVTSCALGSFVGARWERASAGDDADVATTYRRIVAAAPKRQLTHVRRLLNPKSVTRRPTFDERIETVLRGIAVQHGRRWRPLAQSG